MSPCIIKNRESAHFRPDQKVLRREKKANLSLVELSFLMQCTNCLYHGLAGLCRYSVSPLALGSGGIDNLGCSFALTIRATKSRSWNSCVRMQRLTALPCLSRVAQWRLLWLQGNVFSASPWVFLMHTLNFGTVKLSWCAHGRANRLHSTQSVRRPSGPEAPDVCRIYFQVPSPPVCINLRRSLSPAFGKLQNSNPIQRL